MKIQYKLDEEDFIAFQLFSTSKLERIQKRRRRGRILITSMMLILMLLDYWRNNFVMSTFFGAVSVIVWILYPIYFAWRYKRHYEKLIKVDYLDRFGQTEEIEFTLDYIYSKNNQGESKIKMNQIEIVSEINSHFFFKMHSNMSLIIPKREIEDISSFKKKINSLGMKIVDELDWKWG